MDDNPIVVNFMDSILFDSKNNLLNIPQCELCGMLLNMVIGLDSMAWYCAECDV